MRRNAYSVFDSASGVYSMPIFLHSDGIAERQFKDMVGDPEHPVGSHPEDYSLVRFGVWDDNDCQWYAEKKITLMTGMEAFVAIGNADRDRKNALLAAHAGNGGIPAPDDIGSVNDKE